MLQFSQYEDLIHLREPFERYTEAYSDDETRYKEINELIKEIEKDYGADFNYEATKENDEKTMVLIRSFLNERLPSPISDRFLTLLDHYIADFRSKDVITYVSDIPTVKEMFPESHVANGSVLSLFRGDITLMGCDAIVNAANNQMLGCFRAMHKCIDNCIHTFASPRLREDMNKIMEKQGVYEETGQAKITRAYDLPCKFVLHTVGPIYPYNTKENNYKLLASCYNSCLDVASQVPECKSIAFCCISTGVFGFPNDSAAEIAVKTVNRWIDEHPGRFERIIFNVFLEKDLKIYEKILSE